jgi:hypothetical protein
MRPPARPAAVVGGARRIVVPLLLIALAGACASPPTPPPPVQNTRTVDADRTGVIERASGFLDRRGIGPVSVDQEMGTLVAGPASVTSDEWARCPDVRVRDPEGERRRAADRVSRSAKVLVDTKRQGGRTLVTVTPTFSQTLHNSFTNSTFERPCATTGRLERAVLDAL